MLSKRHETTEVDSRILLCALRDIWSTGSDSHQVAAI